VHSQYDPGTCSHADNCIRSTGRNIMTEKV
jgi:uncharacterized Fe-S cluster protein YjdI